MRIDCWLRRTSTTIGKMPARSARGILSRPFMNLPQSGSRYQIRHPSIPLKYQAAAPPTTITDELLTVKLRYKALDDDSSRLLEVPVRAARKSPSTRRLRTSSSLPQWRHSNEAAELSPKREYLLGGYPENRSTQFERRFRNLSCGVSHARRRGSLMNPARAKRLTNRLGDRGR